MSQEHEYALLGGVNRAKVGRYLSLVAATGSAVIVFLLLTVVDVAHRIGVPATLPPSVLSLVGAGTIFTVLYWIFDRYAWRWRYLGSLLKIADLSGTWRCRGRSLNPADGSPQHDWEGTVTILQSWDKLRVHLKTAQSGSNSISAALLNDEAEGYVLLYHYKNDPHIGEMELRSHRGFAELRFAKDLRTAQGDYFNGHGRFTFGIMELTRS
jgi:hypothetical protein